MRRLALGLAALWLVIAFGFRLYDMRKPQVYVSALTGGQRQHLATLSWIEGSLRRKGDSHGRLVVAEVRVDGKLMRYAKAGLPADWMECRLWLEESDQALQGVASCPGHLPLRLTAGNTSIAGLGPDNKPGTLFSVDPLTSVEPEMVVNKVHRHDLAPPHPLLILLGLLAMAPLGVAGLREFRKARRLRARPLVEGVMEHSGNGILTIREGERRVSVFVEQGEVISVGLMRGTLHGDATMAVDGLPAAVQGDVESSTDGAFRGRETMRLRKGALLVVGDVAAEARRRLLLLAGRDAAMAALGMALSTLVAVGLAW